MKKIVVASGKGGAGKTVVASSLSWIASIEHNVVAADCDVDAPNLRLVLGKDKDDEFAWIEVSTSEKAFINEKKCIGCGKCMDVCVFKAIKWNRDGGAPQIKYIYCEGCGACTLVCPTEAIKIKAVKNGRIGWCRVNRNLFLVCGELYVGESASGKIVIDVKKKAVEIARKVRADVMVVDASAGIGCPVIASLAFMDHALLVGEPTPTGVSDLIRMLELADHFGIEKSIIINKYNLNNTWCNKIEKLAREYGSDVIAKIPHDRKVIEAVNHLTPLPKYDEHYRNLFEDLLCVLL